MKATVKWFNAQKGYGFITDASGKDAFVHYSSLVMDGFKTLHEDDIVDFELGTGKNGREQVINVQSILTRKMVENALKERNLYIQTMKDSYGVKKYLLVDDNNVLQTDENGMSFFEVAEYASFDIDQLSA